MAGTWLMSGGHFADAPPVYDQAKTHAHPKPEYLRKTRWRQESLILPHPTIFHPKNQCLSGNSNDKGRVEKRKAQKDCLVDREFQPTLCPKMHCLVMHKVQHKNAFKNSCNTFTIKCTFWNVSLAIPLKGSSHKFVSLTSIQDSSPTLGMVLHSNLNQYPSDQQAVYLQLEFSHKMQVMTMLFWLHKMTPHEDHKLGCYNLKHCWDALQLTPFF